ncbi:MAG: class I SAM-dependent methyltransferase [Ginsengibacter sp.]
MDKVLTVITDRPKFHTAIEGFQNEPEAGNQGTYSSFSLDTPVLVYLAKNARRCSKTLETGAGCSTLILALCGCKHTCITPWSSEIISIQKYAADKEIDLKFVNFINDSSDKVLPQIDEDGFDMILLDGRTSFPWPVIDWFYAIQKLKKDGLMIIHDAHMDPAAILVDYMKSDSDWEIAADFSDKTILFKKKSDLKIHIPGKLRPYTSIKAPATYQHA